ncbi:MAG: hypothetical protein ACRC7O_08800 [Fimbriiglobus sp.]
MGIEHTQGLIDKAGRPLPPTPCLTCDQCWERIDAGTGMVLHFTRPGAPSPAFAHRGECAARLEMENGKALRQELGAYFKALLGAAGFRPKPKSSDALETTSELRLADVRTKTDAAPVKTMAGTQS